MTLGHMEESMDARPLFVHKQGRRRQGFRSTDPGVLAV